MNIGQSIKQLRKRHNISQKELSSRVGTSQTYLSLVESGKRDCSTKFLKAISKELNIPLPALFWFTSEKEDYPNAVYYDSIKPAIDNLIKSLL